MRKKKPKPINVLRREIAAFAEGDLKRDGAFLSTVRASVVKCYEFTKSMQKKRPVEPYFKFAVLRSICEEYISILFISKLSVPDRNELANALLQLRFHELAAKQVAFFEHYRPYQQVIGPSKTVSRDMILDRFKSVADRTGLWHFTKGNPLGTVSYRAEKCGLKDFYDFYYAITSEVVHFSPRSLLRLGWGKNPRNPTFSTNNWDIYYIDVGRVYGSFLLANMIEHYASFIPLSDKMVEAGRAITEDLDYVIRWPEPVTFEEMNIKPPGSLFALMAKLAHENEQQSITSKK